MKKKFSFKFFILMMILLSVTEAALIITGLLPTMISYSPFNLMFSFLRLVLIVYVGVLSAKESLKKSAVNAAILAVVMILVFYLAALVSKQFVGRAVIGITAPNTASLIVMLLIILVENVLLAIILSVLAGWISRKVKKRKS